MTLLWVALALMVFAVAVGALCLVASFFGPLPGVQQENPMPVEMKFWCILAVLALAGAMSFAFAGFFEGG